MRKRGAKIPTMDSNDNIKRIYCVIEKSFLLLVAYYFFYYATYETTIFSQTPLWEHYIYLLAVVAIIKTMLLLTMDSEHRKQWVKLIIFALPVSVLWAIVPNYHAVVLSVLFVGCLGTDYRTLLKIYVAVVGIVVLSAMILSIGGAIENYIYTGDSRGPRSSLGFYNCNGLASFYFFMILAAWMAFEKKSDVFFLVLSILGIVVTNYITRSYTAIICFVALSMIIIWEIIYQHSNRHPVAKKIDGFFRICSTIVFPLFFLIMVSLMLAYYYEVPFANEIDKFSHNRLETPALVFGKQGLLLLPRVHEAQYSAIEYVYWDCGYLDLLLRYGLLLTIFYVSYYPVLTHICFDKGKRRLAFGLALIALYTIEESFFFSFINNALLPLHFSLASLVFIGELKEKGSGDRKEYKPLSAVFSACIMIILIVIISHYFLPLFRTLCSITRPIEERGMFFYQCSWYLVVLCFIFLCALLYYLVHSIIESLVNRKKPSLRIILAVTICLIIPVIVFIGGMNTIKVAEYRYRNVIEEDRNVVEIVHSVDGVKLYVTDIPTLYEKEFGKIDNHFFIGEDLARFSSIAVIIDSNIYSIPFFEEGFSYAEISDTHCLYTDSQEVIDKLRKAGYRVENYFYKAMQIDLEKLANENGLERMNDGSIVISYENPISKGPYVDTREGTYLLSLDISLLMKASTPDSIAFDIRVMDFKGRRRIRLEESISFRQFNEKGKLLLQLPVNLGGRSTEIIVEPKEGVSLALHSIGYEVLR